MKKRKRISLLALILGPIILVSIIAGLWLLDNRAYLEPIYDGKPLSEWLNDYWIFNHGLQEEAVLIQSTNHAIDEIVRKIGTNAIPTLFRMLEKRDSVFRNLAVWSHEKGIHDFKLKSVPAGLQNVQAAMAFEALGVDAKDALPRLIEMYSRKQNEFYQELDALALGGIGPPASNAVPLILKTITNNGLPKVAYSSFLALGRIHAYPEQVVPLMIKFLKDPNVNVRNRAITNLRLFGADAKPAVPALIESLSDSVGYVQTNAARALKVIDPEAAAKAGMK